MDLYAGLDVGLNETSICLVDRDGKTVRELKIATDPAGAAEALAPYATELRRVEVVHNITSDANWELPADRPTNGPKRW